MKNKNTSFFSSIAMKVQLSLIILSLVGIGFSIFTYSDISAFVSQEHNDELLKHILLQIAVACVFNVGLGFIIYGAVTKPVKRLCETIDDISAGNFKIEVPYTNIGSEIGTFAEKIKLFKEKSEKLLEAEKSYSEIRLKEAEERSRKINDMLNIQFNEKFLPLTSSFKNLSSRLVTNANNLLSSTQKSSSFVNNLVSISDQATNNVNTVAEAAEELTSSIAEISAQTTKSASIVESAALKVNTANDKVGSLAEGAEKIGDVVELINDIAEQINLLALNATIEAARAGEAGKGFAVVATEVKNLAEQTANATQEISGLISNIQQQTNSAVASIKEINTTINDINNISKNIADAVEEQSAATREIARNIHEAASHTRDVKKNIEEAATSYSSVEVFSGNMHTSASDIESSTNTLDNEINSFFGVIKSTLN
jgi:methyl-accepting chemotaxis protein